jgi:hypothetical protein
MSGFGLLGGGRRLSRPDRHHRHGQLGSLKTFRIRDFINPSVLDGAKLPRVALDRQVGVTPISWTPGISSLNSHRQRNPPRRQAGGDPEEGADSAAG